MTWKELFIVIICAGACLSQVVNPVPNCTRNGENCFKDDECCSGRCMTFFYKCAHKPTQSAVSHIFADSDPIEGILTGNPSGSTYHPLSQTVVSHTFADLGSKVEIGNEFQNINAFQTINKDCELSGFKCRNDDECCSHSCLTVTSTCSGTEEYYEPPDSSSLKKLINSVFVIPEMPVFHDAAKTNDIINLNENAKVQKISASEVVQRECKALGIKCVEDTDCCSLICSALLSKCAQITDDRQPLWTLVDGRLVKTGDDDDSMTVKMNIRFGEDKTPVPV